MTEESLSESLHATARIKRSKDFREARRRGTTLFTHKLLLVIAPAPSSVSRIGITVSKKVHKRAVRRNYIKRCFRETFRRIRHNLLEERDLVVIARKDAATASFRELDHDLRRALQRAKLLK